MDPCGRGQRETGRENAAEVMGYISKQNQNKGFLDSYGTDVPQNDNEWGSDDRGRRHPERSARV